MFRSSKAFESEIPTLCQIAARLNRGGSNYQVSVGLFRANPSDDIERPMNLIVEALGNKAYVGGLSSTTIVQAQTIIEDALRWPGDEAVHPAPSYVRSEAFNTDIEKALQETELLLKANSLVTEFWLRKGHPFYPVFWDFAFLSFGSTPFVLIGACSD